MAVEKQEYRVDIDSSGARKGAREVSTSVRKMDDVILRAGAGADAMGRGFSSIGRGIGGAAAGLLRFAAPIAGVMAFFGAWNQFSQQIPAVQQSLFQMGVVIRNNLFWPLAQELIPALMKMADWVRNNRVNFLKIGGVLLNVFKTVAAAVSGFLGLARKMFDSFFSALTGGGRATLDGFVRLVNFLLLKIAIIFAILEAELGPFFSLIGKIFGYLARGVFAFGAGFVSSFVGKVFPVFAEFIGLIETAASLFDGELKDSVFTFLGSLGRAIGTVFSLFTKIMFAGVFILMKVVKGILLLIKHFKETEKPFQFLADIWDAISEGASKFWKIIKTGFYIIAPIIMGLVRLLNPISLIFNVISLAVRVATAAFERLERSSFVRNISRIIKTLKDLINKLKEFGKEIFRKIVFELATIPGIGRLLTGEKTLKTLGITKEEVEEYKQATPEEREQIIKRRPGETGVMNFQQQNTIVVNGAGDPRAVARAVVDRERSLAEQFMLSRARLGFVGVG